LEQLASLQRAAPAARIYVVASEASAADIDERNLAYAKSIPRVRLLLDTSGEETARFGCHTSGQLLMFNRDGRLIFSGGLTVGRGEAGANLPFDNALSALTQSGPPLLHSPVFGCPVRTQLKRAAPTF
jgi:hypothetical protein